MSHLRRIAERASAINKKTAVATAIIILGIASFFLFLRALFFVVTLILLNLAAGSLLGKAKALLRNVGIEFVTFSAIFAGFAFGPITGAIVGATTRIAEAIAMRRTYSLPVTAPAYAILGIVAGVLAPANHIAAGIALAVTFSIAIALLTLFALRATPHTVIIFSVTQIAFTVFLINALFPVLFALINL